MGKSGPISNASRKDKTAKELSGNDLCALCFLLCHLLVFVSGGYRERKIFFPPKLENNYETQRAGRTQSG
jgi:hypothetical protein